MLQRTSNNTPLSMISFGWSEQRQLEIFQPIKFAFWIFSPEKYPSPWSLLEMQNPRIVVLLIKGVALFIRGVVVVKIVVLCVLQTSITVIHSKFLSTYVELCFLNTNQLFCWGKVNLFEWFLRERGYYTFEFIGEAKSRKQFFFSFSIPQNMRVWPCLLRAWECLQRACQCLQRE